jgi:leucyl-tRNA synthetase
VVEPETLFQKYGSDTARLYILFSAPIEKDIDWSDESVAGCSRLLDRVYRLVFQHQESVRIWMKDRTPPGELSGGHKDIHRSTHAMIQKVTGDIEERLQFNTAIAAQMEYLNDLQKYAVSEAPEPALIGEGLEALLFMLSPFAPHISEHLWQLCGGEGFLIDRPWLSCDRAALEVDEIQIVVQVNGKVRSSVTVPKSSSREAIQAAALGDEKVAKHIEGKEIRKVIVVPGKLINIVV